MGLWPIYQRAFALLATNRGGTWGLLAANVLAVAAVFAEPILFGRVVDVLTSLKGDQHSEVWSRALPLLAAWVLVGLFAIVCAALIALFADRLAHRRRHEVLRDYFEHVLQLPAHHRQTQHSGRLMKIMLQGTDALWSIWLGFLRDYFAAFVAVVILMPVAFYLNATMAGLLLLVSVLFVVLTRLVLRRTENLQRAVESHYSDMAEHVADSLGNVALVQGFARVKDEVKTLRELSDNVISAQFPALSWWALVNVLTRSATTLTVLAMLCLGLWLFSRNAISIGEIVTFIGFAGLIMSRLEQAVSFANRLSVDAPKLREFFEVQAAQHTVLVDKNPIEPAGIKGQIDFVGVSYAYEPDAHWAIKNLNLTIEAGQTVALVGSSGAGKSTLLSLLCRLFDPQEGAIRLDGIDIRRMTLEGLRRHIGVVFQESLLFNRSVAENLRVGDPGASHQALRQAAEQASALSFIEQLPKGFDTDVGERGRLLSGGQRQRLAIARVLLKNPAILLLDEATSALDAKTEELVQHAMTRAQQGRTTLVIAHRLSTIRHADRIVMLEAGRIVESGTFDELMSLQGSFAAMVQAQFSMRELLNG